MQNEETRKRLKFLRHLPLAAEFQLVELDLSGVLPGEALAPFAEELDAREKRRQRRVKAQARESAKDARRMAAEALAKQVAPCSPSLPHAVNNSIRCISPPPLPLPCHDLSVLW